MGVVEAPAATAPCAPAGARPSGSGSAATGRPSDSTGSAGASTTAACAMAGSSPRASETWSSPARRCPPSRVPSRRSPAGCPRWAPLATVGVGQGGGEWQVPRPRDPQLCSLLHSLPDCGSPGPRTGVPSPGRGRQAPCPAPAADPRSPVPHLLQQRPLWLFPPAPPQEDVCGPHELSGCCRLPQGKDASPPLPPPPIFPDHPPPPPQTVPRAEGGALQRRSPTHILPDPALRGSGTRFLHPPELGKQEVTCVGTTLHPGSLSACDVLGAGTVGRTEPVPVSLPWKGSQPQGGRCHYSA